MADEPAAQEVVFHEPKAGSTEAEWEDCAGLRPAAPGRAGIARYVVVDGATEAYDSLRWVRQLVTAFLGTDGSQPPAITRDGIDGWIAAMQDRWLDEAPRSFATVFEERKFHDAGSFATFLGCDITGLGGGQPSWRAAAIGDAVLYLVRTGQVVEQLPRMAPDEFGLNPEGLFTQPAARDRMRAALQLGHGRLQVGDLLFLATDALAEWLARRSTADGGACWHTLAAMRHPTEFRRFVAAERRERRMKNDDVTLLRVEITPAEADVLVVCR